MTLEMRVAFSSNESDENGTVFVKLLKGIWDTDTQKWAEWAPGVPITHPHRFPVEANVTPEDQMAVVKTSLEQWGYTVPDEVGARVSKRVKAMRE